MLVARRTHLPFTARTPKSPLGEVIHLGLGGIESRNSGLRGDLPMPSANLKSHSYRSDVRHLSTRVPDKAWTLKRLG